MPAALEIVGFVTHGIVLAIGIGGVLGIVPLARGRRAGGRVHMPAFRALPPESLLALAAYLDGLQ